MAIQGNKRKSTEELAFAQVGDLDQILDDFLDQMLDMEWSKEIVRNHERLHQQNVSSDVIIDSKLQNPAYSDQLTRRLRDLFTQRKQLMNQSIG